MRDPGCFQVHGRYRRGVYVDFVRYWDWGSLLGVPTKEPWNILALGTEILLPFMPLHLVGPTEFHLKPPFVIDYAFCC